MINFIDTPNPLFDTVFRLHRKLADSKLATDKLEDCREDLEEVTRFFNCTFQEAAVLAVFLRMSVLSNSPSVKQVLQHFSLKPSFASALHQVVQVFVEKNWMKPTKDIRLQPLTSYQLSNRLIMAFNCMDPEKLQDKPVSNSIEMASRMQQFVTDRTSRVISFQEYVDRIWQLLHQHQEIPLACKILETKPSPADAAFCAFFCARFVKGADQVEINELLREIQPPQELRYRLRQAFRMECGFLFEQDLLSRNEQDNFIGEPQFTVSDSIQRLFEVPEEVVTGKTGKFKSELMRIRDAGTIHHCHMIYNPAEEDQVLQLHRLLQPALFDRFVEQMKAQGLPGGLNILLYGASGTGKTETVLQLCRNSGRSILQVDASAIRSKWVGETEKNLSLVFRDYTRVRKQTGLAPILLFNEADAILTRRCNVKERGDHYENAIQNLLLQQLEDFEGIFIGTTNLSENLDPAFQRRLLFKIQFDKPGLPARQKLFAAAFPDLPEEICHEFASGYDMTGSEIMNVKKKLTIERILKADLSDLDLMHSLCKYELCLKSDSSRKSIGFRRA